jgi:hypothetical protein
VREFGASLIALSPDMNGLVEGLEKARNMIICHLLIAESGHLQLLKLNFDGEYLRSPRVPQTTLCTASDEIKS